MNSVATPLALGSILSLSLCLDLGIVNVTIIREALRRGFVPAFLIGLGSCCGDLFYAVTSLAGIRVLEDFLWLRRGLWVGGTLACLYMGCKMLTVFVSGRGEEIEISATEAAIRTPLRNFFAGILLAVASPSAVLWYATIGGNMLFSIRMQSRHEMLEFLVGFFATGVLFSAALALTTHLGSRVSKPAVSRTVSLISSLLFLFMAIQGFIAGYRSEIWK